MDYQKISKAIAESGYDGWLVYDYRGSNPVLQQLLGRSFMLTRRAFLLLKPSSPPRFLVSRVDFTDSMDELAGVTIDHYTTWQELRAWLEEHISPLRTVAMEYSPNGELPGMSWVDGGTLDIVRSQGVDVKPSAELFQLSAAAWTPDNLRSHQRAMNHIVEIKDAAFGLAASRLAAGEPCDESLVQTFIVEEFKARGLVTDDPPIVSVNSHSGDPHYAPSAEAGAVIKKGDWLLIDLWAKENMPEGVFADITWVGYFGPTLPQRYADVFDTVARARDAVVEFLEKHGAAVGFQLDDIARNVIRSAGYGDNFVHRTGHSLSTGDSVHGLGANLDDFETRDTRSISSGLGFTIEPGIYLPEFGVRSEINVYMDTSGPTITSPVQEKPLTFEI